VLVLALTLFLQDKDILGAEEPQGLILENSFWQITVYPGYGGKIRSIKTSGDFEILSQSERPLQDRGQVSSFAETEFDGIDEIFPSLKSLVLERPGLPALSIPEHGWLFNRAWQVTELSDQHTVMRVELPKAALSFERTIRLSDDTIHLDYTVSNAGASPFPFIYIFHPLFRADRAMTLDIQPDEPVIAGFSNAGWIGAPGEQTVWSHLPGPAETPLFRRGFQPEGNTFFKIYLPNRTPPQFTLDYGSAGSVTLHWDPSILPHLALWSNEGRALNLNHIAPEPTNSLKENLFDAISDGSALVVEPKNHISWSICLTWSP
jgi:hypothetical protein